MIPSRLAAMFAGVAALALAAGCGDDSREEGATAASPSKAQYVRAATAVCARQHGQISDQLDAVAEKLRRGVVDRGEVEAAMENVILPGFRSEYEELRRLPPPRGDEDFLDLMLSKFSRSLENGEEKLSRLFRLKLSAYSEFAEGSLMTREYGIRGCGSLRRSPRAVVREYALP